MQQKNTTSQVSSNLSGVFRSAWPQALIAGTVTLIPVRKYPRWLRRTLIWGPVAVATAGATALATNPKVLEKIQQRLPREDNRSAPQEPSLPRRPAALVATGVSVGAVMSLSTAVGFWADEKIERGLRRLHLPYPRVIMALGAGAAAWWQERQAQHKA